MGLSQEVGLDDEKEFNFQSYEYVPVNPAFILAPPEAPTLLPNVIFGKEAFPGQYNFQICLNHENSNKNSWMYSPMLHKVFIIMGKVLPLHFIWQTPQNDNRLWIRVKMVFKDDQDRSQPVLRCPNHIASDDCDKLDPHCKPRFMKHVIRCLNHISSYEEAPDGHLSVSVPIGVHKFGLQNAQMDLSFYCKNSCPSLKRRATKMIITLETETNQVLGRQVLEVRICSCPKRDLDKEEKQDDPVTTDQKVEKRRKTRDESNISLVDNKIASDTDTYEVQINVLGHENAQAILKYAHDVHAGAALRSGNPEIYRPYMNEILDKLHL